MTVDVLTALELAAAVLPPSVRYAACTSDRTDVMLTPTEQATIAGAGPRRRAEFTTTRACAHDALAELGVAPAPVLPDADRCPTWPAGVVGSITHTQGYRAAAVASAHDVSCVGIDAEQNTPLPYAVTDLVLTQSEREHLQRMAGRPTSIPLRGVRWRSALRKPHTKRGSLETGDGWTSRT